RRAGKIEFDEIYAILDDQSKGKAPEWAQRYRESKAYQEYVVKPLAGKLSPEGAPTVQDAGRKPQPAAKVNARKVSSLKQFFVLSARNIKLLTRDKFALGLMLATAPLVSLLDVVLSAVMGRDPFSFQDGDIARVMITLF